MIRSVLVSSLAITFASSLVFLSGRLLGPQFVFFFCKLGIVFGSVASLLIGTSLYLYGETRTQNLLVNVLVFMATTLVMFTSCEFIARIVFRNITTTRDNSSYFARKWKKKNVQLNSLGFREVEFDQIKSEELYRIAIIGDSLTFGQGIKSEERFSNILQTHLQNRGDFQVLNFGKPGAESIDHLIILRTVVLKAEPDFVILQWSVNDFEGHDKSGRPSYYRLLPSDTLSSTLHRSSAFYFLLNRKWISLQIKLGLSGSHVTYMYERFGDPQSPDSLEALDAISHFIDECEVPKIGIGIVLFPNLLVDDGGPYPFAYLHERVMELCYQKEVLCLDLLNTFAQYADRKRLWANVFDAHPGPLANQIAANRLIETFAPIWLFSSP